MNINNTMDNNAISSPAKKEFAVVSNRLNGINEYYFSQKLRQLEEMNKAGRQVINLGIGSPDLPPHPEVIATLAAEAAKPDQHAYQSYKGSPVLRNAIATWYKKWYHVSLDPGTEVLPLMGSKEGVMHVCMTYLNPGDEVLIPNPGYPTYKSAASIAGGVIKDYVLKEENDWLPDFDALENQGLSKVKLMFVNYPQMPSGKLATAQMFKQLISFAKTHHILICHDNPYSFILPDFSYKNKPLSILSFEGAKEVAVELNSLSKSHNMAGWRIGFLCGASERINEVLRFKSNMDSGMFLPIQLAAAKALQLDESWFHDLNSIYEKRRKKVFELLQLLGCSFSKDQAGLFVWASIPPLYETGYELSDYVLENSNVFITPGGIFGNAGDKYVRVSLCTKEEVLDKAIERVKKMKERKSAVPENENN